MSKIICNSVDYVFSRDVEKSTPENVTLKPAIDWINLPVKEKPTYSAEHRQADPGPTCEETVTAITRCDTDTNLKQSIAFGVVLRMRTDEKTFYVGSERFPCMTELTSDRISNTFTFKSTSSLY